MELIEFVTAMGHDVVAAGKGKNNPLNVDAVPDDYREEATRRNMNPRMLVEFVDGSKTMVELACIAMFITSAPSRLPANSKLACVRVEFSKNMLICVRPASASPCFMAERLSFTY